MGTLPGSPGENAMRETIAVFPKPQPQIRRVPVDRAWVWLAAGWRDMVSEPRQSLAWGLVPVVAGCLTNKLEHLPNCSMTKLQ